MKRTRGRAIRQEFAYFVSGMEECSARHYIMGRVIEQMEWFDKRSVRNQRAYKLLTTLSILVSSVIPVITLFSDAFGGFGYKLVIVILSWSITAAAAINAFGRFRQLWIQYRAQCEMLKCILYRFFARCGEFSVGSGASLYAALVSRCEEYMRKETDNWALMVPYDRQNHTSSTGS